MAFYNNRILGHQNPYVANSIGCQMFSGIASGRYQNRTPKFIGYTGLYALCTSAKCVQDPDNPFILNCYCDVNNGPAVGLNNGINFNLDSSGQVYSLYSGVNQSLLAKQTCNSGAWGDCLNQICTIDPNDSTKAYCRCVKVNTSPWITFQHKNDPRPCNCSNLSGAINRDYEEIETFYKLYAFGSR